MDKSVKVFAPATVANVGPGYDVMGLALEYIGDVIEMKLVAGKEISIQIPTKSNPSGKILHFYSRCIVIQRNRQ